MIKLNLTKNKKGYYRFADIGMFILSFALIGVAIAIVIFVFYSHNVDVREQEIRILADTLTESSLSRYLPPDTQERVRCLFGTHIFDAYGTGVSKTPPRQEFAL